MTGVPPYPAVPATSVYADGPLVVSELRGDLTNGVTYLANRPVFSAYSTQGGSVTGGTYQAIPMETENYDTWGGHSPFSGNAPQNYYCQSPGWYIAEAIIPVVAPGAVNVTAALGLNNAGGLFTHEGAQLYIPYAREAVALAADLMPMTRGGTVGDPNADYIQAQVTASKAGVSLVAQDGVNPVLSIRWAGTGSASSLAVPSNPGWPVPPAPVTAAWLNANVSDAVTFLSNPPMLRAWSSAGGQSVPAATWPAAAKVTLDQTSLDNYSAWEGGTSEYRVPVSGIYYAAGLVTLIGVTGQFASGLLINGAVTWLQAGYTDSSSSQNAGPLFATRLRLSAGDTVALAAFGAATAGLPSRLVLAWEAS